MGSLTSQPALAGRLPSAVAAVAKHLAAS